MHDIDPYLPEISSENSVLKNSGIILFNAVFWIVEASLRATGRYWGPDYQFMTQIIAAAGLVSIAAPISLYFAGTQGWLPALFGGLSYLVLGGLYFLHNHDWGV